MSKYTIGPKGCDIRKDGEMLMAVEVLALLAELDDAITESTANMIALQYVKEDYEELRAENDTLLSELATALNYIATQDAENAALRKENAAFSARLDAWKSR